VGEKKLNGTFFENELGAKWRGGVPEAILGATIDSRKILRGEIFVAIKTATRDGHDFLAAARERGAAGALVSRYVPELAPFPQLVVPDTVAALQKIARAHREKNCAEVVIFGITGSVGKTSTKDLLARVLSETAPTLATEGNLNNTLGVPMTLLKINPAIHRFAVVEAGMSVRGEMQKLAEMISPDFSIVTNVRPAHLEGLGSMENIAHEKSALAAATRSTAFFYRELLAYESFSSLPQKKYFLAVDSNFSEVPDGFEIKIFGEKSDGNAEIFRLKNVSRGIAENAVLVVLAARKFVSPEKIAHVLASWKPSAKRGELRERACGGKIFVDCYNASPASMLDSAENFARIFPAGTPRLFVLGGMGELGERSVALHFSVGEKLPLCAKTDTLALFGGNAVAIGEGAISAGFSRERVFVFDDICALKKIIENFRGNVMVKGSRAFALERALPEN